MSVSEDFLQNDAASTLFTSFELWGIAIATLYFLIGFPGNILCIVVCFKSLFYRFFRRFRLKKRSRFQNKHLDDSMRRFASFAPHKFESVHATRAPSIPNQENEISLLDRNKSLTHHQQCSRHLASSKNSTHQLVKPLRSSQTGIKYSVPFKKECNQNEIELNDNPKQARVKANSFNPHRKCFELYLIEISFCDLIIIGYNFIEWFLLILSELKLFSCLHIFKINLL